MTIKDKLKQYLDYKGISPSGVERRMGWGMGTMVKTSSISSDKLKDFLLMFPDLSAEWLVRDEGEMIRKTPTLSVDLDRICKLVDTIATLQETINEKNKTIMLLTERIAQLKNKQR